jgi:hypothetical protein
MKVSGCRQEWIGLVRPKTDKVVALIAATAADVAGRQAKVHAGANSKQASRRSKNSAATTSRDHHIVIDLLPQRSSAAPERRCA